MHTFLIRFFKFGTLRIRVHIHQMVLVLLDRDISNIWQYNRPFEIGDPCAVGRSPHLGSVLRILLDILQESRRLHPLPVPTFII